MMKYRIEANVHGKQKSLIVTSKEEAERIARFLSIGAPRGPSDVRITFALKAVKEDR